ncbi:MAG: DUF2161 family putative PD-(D/E)XK-type phosphodiesterase [Lachnospiraceae bacterium]|nr:DUF2161 family putative PD-(D/E)XK-type phosphodiesterase [Lachnospiraceae bacterium]
MEKDLFLPIKKYFEQYGYVADGEVGDIDLYMEKGDESVAVELKVKLDFRSVQQAAQRQKLVDTVFIGIFKPKDLNSRSFQDKIYILKRLGIGLIVVSKRMKTVEIVSEPVVSELQNYKNRNKRKKDAISEEFKKRRTKSNTGGVRGEKLITGYREDALLVLDTLAELGGVATTKAVREQSGIKRSTDIMHANYYGWFSNVDRGIYKIRQAGYDALEEFEDTIYLLRRGGTGSSN